MIKKLLFISLLLPLLCVSCDDEMTSIIRPVEYMNIYIPRTIEKKALLQTSPTLVYNTVNLVPMNLKYVTDTIYNVGAYCGGMVLPSQNIHLEFGLAIDSLISLQGKGIAESIYQLLPDMYYEIENWDITINKGQTNGRFPVLLRTSLIPSGSKYVLPLKIKSTSHYSLDPQRSFILFSIDKP